MHSASSRGGDNSGRGRGNRGNHGRGRRGGRGGNEGRGGSKRNERDDQKDSNAKSKATEPATDPKSTPAPARPSADPTSIAASDSAADELAKLDIGAPSKKSRSRSGTPQIQNTAPDAVPRPPSFGDGPVIVDGSGVKPKGKANVGQEGSGSNALYRQADPRTMAPGRGLTQSPENIQGRKGVTSNAKVMGYDEAARATGGSGSPFHFSQSNTIPPNAAALGYGPSLVLGSGFSSPLYPVPGCGPFPNPNYVAPQGVALGFGTSRDPMPGYAPPQAIPYPTYQSMTGFQAQTPAHTTAPNVGQSPHAYQSPYTVDSRGVMKNVEHGTVSITGYKGVFVGNLDPNTIASDLHDALGSYGRCIQDITFHRKRRSALIQLRDPDSASEAIKRLDKCEIRASKVEAKVDRGSAVYGDRTPARQDSDGRGSATAGVSRRAPVSAPDFGSLQGSISASGRPFQAGREHTALPVDRISGNKSVHVSDLAASTKEHHIRAKLGEELDSNVQTVYIAPGGHWGTIHFKSAEAAHEAIDILNDDCWIKKRKIRAEEDRRFAVYSDQAPERQDSDARGSAISDQKRSQGDGPVIVESSPSIKITNVPWTVDRSMIESVLGFLRPGKVVLDIDSVKKDGSQIAVVQFDGKDGKKRSKMAREHLETNRLNGHMVKVE